MKSLREYVKCTLQPIKSDYASVTEGSTPLMNRSTQATFIFYEIHSIDAESKSDLHMHRVVKSNFRGTFSLLAQSWLKTCATECYTD